MKLFSRYWNRSKKPKKQRKYRYNAPLHLLQRFASAHLSKELRAKHKIRSITIRKGDKVKIARGQFRGKSGKIERVNLKKGKAYITGIEIIKKDGTKSMYPIHPSNLIITELNLEDKMRMGKENGKQS